MRERERDRERARERERVRERAREREREREREMKPWPYIIKSPPPLYIIDQCILLISLHPLTLLAVQICIYLWDLDCLGNGT